MMTCSPVSQQVVVPVIGFTASIGSASMDLRARNAAGAARFGTGQATEARYDRRADVIDYLAIAFVALAVAFGPAIVSLL